MASEDTVDIGAFLLGEISDIKQQLSDIKRLIGAIRQDRVAEDPLSLGGFALDRKKKSGYNPLDERATIDGIRKKARRRGKKDRRAEALATDLKMIWHAMLGDAATYSDDMFYETARSALSSYAFEDDEIICSALKLYLDSGDPKPSLITFKRKILAWINMARLKAVSEDGG